MNSTPYALFPASQFGEILSSRELGSALSGARVYAITTDQGSFVLRWQAQISSSLAIHRLVSEAGIAPELLFADEVKQITVSANIAGMNFGAALGQESSRGPAMQSLTQTLKKLQGLPLENLKPQDPWIFAKKIWEAQSTRTGFPKAWKAYESRLSEAEQQASSDPRLVLSHCDLNPSNLIWDGQRVWILDWDGAGPAHPYLDPATLANFLDLPDATALGWIGSFQEKVDPKVLSAYRDLARLVYGSVFLSLIPDLSLLTWPAPSPKIGEVFGRMARGEIALAAPDTQALIAAAFYAQVI